MYFSNWQRVTNTGTAMWQEFFTFITLMYERKRIDRLKPNHEIGNSLKASNFGIARRRFVSGTGFVINIKYHLQFVKHGKNLSQRFRTKGITGGVWILQVERQLCE